MYAKGGKGSAVPSDSQAPHLDSCCLSLCLPSRTWPPGRAPGVCTAQRALH
uniref:Single stranded DNA binding protein 4 n=1 Tax=Cebus imitator TaxID=2715852 RepID=A0A2K5QWZ4_CEBIM